VDNRTTNKTTKQSGTSTDSEPAPVVKPSIALDCELFQHHLDDCDLTDKQKRDFLDALWFIIVSFVDLGFGVHPLQQAMPHKGCEQNGVPVQFPPHDFGDMIGSSNSPKPQFTTAVEGSTDPSGKRTQS